MVGCVRAWAGAASLVAVFVLGACSGDPQGSGSLPEYTPEATVSAPSSSASSASPVPSVSAVSGQAEFSAEALSAPEEGFVIKSVPEGLEPREQDAVRAFAAYDEETWLVMKVMDGDPSTLANNTTDAGYERFTGVYNSFLDQDIKVGGEFSVAIMSVDVDDYVGGTIEVCEDQRLVTLTDSSGLDVTTADFAHPFHRVYMLELSSGSWKVSGSSDVGVDDC